MLMVSYILHRPNAGLKGIRRVFKELYPLRFSLTSPVSNPSPDRPARRVFTKNTIRRERGQHRRLTKRLVVCLGTFVCVEQPLLFWQVGFSGSWQGGHAVTVAELLEDFPNLKRGQITTPTG